MDRDAVYFVSDAHFGLDADEGGKVARFAELAAQMRARASDVFIVGDMFDFWIEYSSVIRRDYFPVLHEMRGLVEAGVRVHYIAGNHDFALGTFLEEAVGMRVHRGEAEIELQGRIALISHGDGILKSGILRITVVLLRNRLLQALYKAIHPTLGIWAGKSVSAVSKSKYRNAEVSPEIINKYRQAAEARIRGGGYGLVIFAHTHHADLVSFDGGDYCNTGSWLDNYDYAVLRDGRIQLMRWGG
ncbi:MAG: UDP-2,3-diacylglucosamine diphosphatase [Chitinispirillia bacterium]|nr:UDP-2,3-diacylglucosamine diphosphatase [Chitinispirillia bacterium]MCL2240925.1 UDP-2,3-diacylglucosamine diphosphatase [Chitinispirillia bacterium]MCL2242103.1 UDP-2,3-diacylglucosamine diphosphatase [Chitinispirillia bacterium]